VGLCGLVPSIHEGRVQAWDPPATIERRLQRDAIFEIETTIADQSAVSAISALPGVRNVMNRASDRGSIFELVLAEERVLAAVIGLMEIRDIRLLTLTKREPTLEDVFVELVGRSRAEVEHVA